MVYKLAILQSPILALAWSSSPFLGLPVSSFVTKNCIGKGGATSLEYPRKDNDMCYRTALYDATDRDGNTASSSSSPSLCDLTPTPADLELKEWYDSQGIFSLDGDILAVTTPKSLGGRGLFATRDLARNSAVASIPRSLIIAASITCDDDLQENEEEEEEWQVVLTNQVLEILISALRDNNSTSSRSRQNLIPWISSWAPPPPEACNDDDSTIAATTIAFDPAFPSLEPWLRRIEKDSEQDVKNIFEEMKQHATWMQDITDSGAITEEGLKMDVLQRMQNFQRRMKKLQPMVNESSKIENDNNYISKWYSLVLSRSAYLGRAWGKRATGLVPFFDMLNHSHEPGDANVELKCVGDVYADDCTRVGLDPKDMILVLTKDIQAGDELLTQYETNIVGNEENQLKLLLQYGIPPPSRRQQQT